MASKLYNFVNHNYLCKESMSASQSTENQNLNSMNLNFPSILILKSNIQ